jgi:hypothetical protein
MKLFMNLTLQRGPKKLMKNPVDIGPFEDERRERGLESKQKSKIERTL